MLNGVSKKMWSTETNLVLSASTITLPLHSEFVTMSLECEYCHLILHHLTDLTSNCSWGLAFTFFRYFFLELEWLKIAQRHLDVLKCANGINAAFIFSLNLPSRQTSLLFAFPFCLTFGSLSLSLDRTYLVLQL